MFYDEFSVCERPTMFYAWALRNSRPQVKSNERCRRRCNGLLAVDALTAEINLQLKDKAKAEDIADYLAELVVKAAGQGLKRSNWLAQILNQTLPGHGFS